MNTGSKQTASYHHGDLKRGLLDAADELLSEVGLQGFTLRACARKAGVSHAAPKHHFGDVSGLLEAVAERGYERLTTFLTVALEKAKGNLVAEMQATCQAYVSFAEAYPEHFRIMFRSDLISMNAEEPCEAVVNTFMELTNVILRQRGEPELGLETLRQEKADALLNDIIIGWCYIHGFAHLKLEGQLGMIPESSNTEQMNLAAERLSHLISQAN